MKTTAPSPSPSEARQVRVFISSTFRDMHAERDHLVTVVFPELRERLERLGLEFFDVDLRWGVPAKDADGETANSWEYCRQWIDRVEPFFVCMLGQRYGWVPEPGQLKAEEDRQRQQEERRSITDMEIRHAVLTTRLKRRSYFYLRNREAPATATEFVDPPPLLEKLVSLKAEVRTCGRPVWDYPCEWTGSGFAGMEEFGRRVLEDLWSGVLRDERYVRKDVWRQELGTDPDNDPRYADEAIPVPRELWEKIVALAKPPPKDPLDAEREQMDAFAASRLRWFQGRTEELETLAGFIESTGPDDARLAVVAAVPGQGKSALLAKLSVSLSTDHCSLITDHSPLLITHFVGATERSASAHALVGRLLAELDRSGIAWPADEQKEGEEPKQDFNSQCLRLAKRLGDYAGERRIVLLLDALNQLSDGHDLNWLPQRLGPSVRVVVSCVDDPTAKEDGPEKKVLHALASRQPAPLRVPLGSLTEADVRVIVVAYLREYCKELDTPHVETICATPQARNPLYLLVMLGELRTLGGNEMNEVVPKLLDSMVTDYPDTVALFRWVLQRLEVFGSEAVRWWCLYLAHGRVGMASHELVDLLARKLGPDAAATALLIERGLRRYLLRRGGQLDFFHGQLRQAVMEQHGLQAEPVAVHHELADYLTTCAKGTDPQKEWETASVRGFSECVFHLTKAGHHDQAAGLLSNFPFLLHKLRVGLLEGVFEDYELVQAGRDGPASQSSSDLEIWSAFFREKAHILRRGNDEWPVHKILLQLAVEHADDSPLSIAAEKWLKENRCDWLWIRLITRPVNARTNGCIMVMEHPGPVSGALELSDGRLLSWGCDRNLRIWNNQNGRCEVVLSGHYVEVAGALQLSNNEIASWSKEPEILMLWDVRSGISVRQVEIKGTLESCLEKLSGGKPIDSYKKESKEIANELFSNLSGQQFHSSGKALTLCDEQDEIWRALRLSDGTYLSWGGSDSYSPRFWSERGEKLGELRGHTSSVMGAIRTNDGRLVTWSLDGTLRIWDTHYNDCNLFVAHNSDISRLVELPDGSIVSVSNQSGSSDAIACLWSPEGEQLACLRDRTAKTRDGRWLSWIEDWMYGWVVDSLEISDGKQRWRVFDHSADKRENLCRLSCSDGRFLSWQDQGKLCILDPNGEVAIEAAGPSGKTKGALETKSGNFISWAEDSLLRIWDKDLALLAILKGHKHPVVGVIETEHEEILSWDFLSDELRVWQKEGHPLCTISLEEGLIVFKEFRARFRPSRGIGDWYSDTLNRAGRLRNLTQNRMVSIYWHGDSKCNAQKLKDDGRIFITQSNGQVCILKLHYGNRRITLAEAEAILVERGDLLASEASPQ